VGIGSDCSRNQPERTRQQKHIVEVRIGRDEDELHRVYPPTIERNRKLKGDRNDTHQADLAEANQSRHSGLRCQLQLTRARNGGGGDHDATLSRVSRRKPPRARFISAPLKGGSVKPLIARD
jgi:hypothetical protein